MDVSVLDGPEAALEAVFNKFQHAALMAELAAFEAKIMTALGALEDKVMGMVQQSAEEPPLAPAIDPAAIEANLAAERPKAARKAKGAEGE